MYQTKTYFQEGGKVKVPISPLFIYLILFYFAPKTEISIYRVTTARVETRAIGEGSVRPPILLSQIGNEAC